MKKWAVHCAVSWCVCLTKKRSQYCAVHATRGKDFRLEEVVRTPAVQCAECDDTGECPDCNGEGLHYCDHARCSDRHDCGACDGSGDCQSCAVQTKQRREIGTFDERYIAFAFDPGWVPYEPFDRPWEAVS